MKNQFSERVDALRLMMKEAGISATIIPKTDPHQSEYLAEHWQVIRYITGFTGSAATLVVTSDKAMLWTDSRYFLQAADQLEGTGIELMKMGLPDSPTINSYLLDTLPHGATVGIDGMLFSIDETSSLSRQLGSSGITLDVNFSPFDALWPDRPALPADPVFIHDTKYTGEEAADKIKRVLAEVKKQDADATLICDLAEIAWTLNIRCNDVQCNPVATSFLYLTPEGSTLFIDPVKITDEMKIYFADCGIATAPYTSTTEAMASLTAGGKVLLSATQSAGAFLSILDDRAVVGDSPVALLKAVKNEVQIGGMRSAMERDGVALVKSMMEIERRLNEGDDTLDEVEVARILTSNRSQQPLYFDDSFDTIAGWGDHGAIVHYEATPESSYKIVPGNLLLIDSGAQYLDGTTDITRTISLGIPTADQQHDFTLVLKGMIALSRAVYPEGTRGVQLDALARQYLWAEGLTFLHGTGHGVGQFLNVHEGPQSIRMNDTHAPLLPGMITSNEPGLYRAGKWGIRCENLVLTTRAMTTEYGNFYKFETLTLFPFDLSLLDLSFMSRDEIDWLNNYHIMVNERLSPMLSPEEKQWLDNKTRIINYTK